MIQLLVSPRLLRPLFWLMLVFSLVMAVLPQPPSVMSYDVGDKIQHVLAFGSLTLVGRLAWPQMSIWPLLVLLTLFGLAIELIQSIPVLHRDSDWRDWLADSIAIACGGVIAQFLVRMIYGRDMT